MKCSDIFDTFLENIPTGESEFLRGELKFEIIFSPKVGFPGLSPLYSEPHFVYSLHCM